MHRERSQEGLAVPNLNPGSAISEAELRAYSIRKRSMVVGSIVLAAVAALVIATRSQIAAVALVTGALCGITNALLSMRGNERLLDHRSVGSFVFGSVLRIGVFGIVPVEFGLHAPAWTMGVYFVGFFMPLGLYAVNFARTLRTD